MMNKKAFFKVVRMMLFWGIMGGFFYAGTGWAANAVFTEAYDKLYETFSNARSVVYVLAGFGLVGVATAAIFGKLSFRWLVSIAVALFVLASAEELVKTVVEGDKLTSPMAIIDPSGISLDNLYDNSFTSPAEFNTNTSGKTVLDSAKIQ